MPRNHKLPNDCDVTPMPQQDLAAGKELTSTQRLAEATHGVATLPNAITTAGIAGTLLGCHEIEHGHHLRGLGIIAVSAICDAADGYTARRTRVANYRAGRWADIAADGIKALAISKTTLSAKLVKGHEIAFIYGPKVANWAINGVSQFILHHEAKTTGEGKVAEASRWVAMAALADGRMLEQGGYKDAGHAIKCIGRLATATSFALGVKSTFSYLKEMVDLEKTKSSFDQ